MWGMTIGVKRIDKEYTAFDKLFGEWHINIPNSY